MGIAPSWELSHLLYIMQLWFCLQLWGVRTLYPNRFLLHAAQFVSIWYSSF